MAVFPTTPIPIIPYDFWEEHSTVVSGPSPGGAFAARSERLIGLYRCTLVYPKKLRASLITIWNFHRSVHGKATRFTFIDFQGWDSGGVQWDDLWACVATAGQTVVDLPIYAGSGHVVKKNGSSIGATITAGGGPDSRDRATVAALAKGDLITVSALGRRMHYARFLFDYYKMSAFQNGLISPKEGLEITEDRT